MMRWVAILSLVVLGAGTGWADDEDLLHDATMNALEQVLSSLEQSEKVAAVKRIGVVDIEGDTVNAVALAKTALTKTRFDVILTNDQDWGPLLTEFARQVKRGDIINPETAHSLRAQGVDAVLYGSIDKKGVEQVQEGALEGKRATVRMLLNLASLAEENPGSLLWSEVIKGTSDDLSQVSPETQVVSFLKNYRLFVSAGAVIVVLLVLWRMYRGMVTPR